MSLNIQGLFILFFLLGLCPLSEAHLKGKNSAYNVNNGDGHITAQLACQAPPHRKKTLEVIGYPDPVYKDYFGGDEEVWAAVNPHTGGHDYAYKEARIYVVQHKKEGQWDDCSRLIDVSGDGYEIVTIQPGCANGNYTRILDKPGIREAGYDVVVDFHPFGVYNKGGDILDCKSRDNLDGIKDRGGFYVPGQWVCLESISFNHNSSCITYDAINIRKNYLEDVHVPEWRKGEKSYPAAYVRNCFITIKAVFSAAEYHKNITIRAEAVKGNLGDIAAGELYLIPNFLFSFRVSGCTPDEITSFSQEWKWYLQAPASSKACEEVHIGNTINKIFIVLAEPQCPWTRTGRTKPWADALEYSCRWAKGEPTGEGAAIKITQSLFSDIGGKYNNEFPPIYSKTPYDNLKLTIFVKNIPSVNDVNCYVMGKALVTFSNVVGSGLIYRHSDPFGKLGCIKLIGKKWNCGKHKYIDRFKNHSFGSINDNIFDACLIASPFVLSYEQVTIQSPWMINIPWEDYIERVVENDIPAYPEAYTFGLDRTSPCQEQWINEDDKFKRRLRRVKEKYKFQTLGKNDKVISGLAISEKTLPQLHHMKKVWKTEAYTLETVQKTTFLSISQLWKSGAGDDQFQATMVVGPSSEKIHEYLILSYAYIPGPLPERTRIKNIGQVCLGISQKPEGPFSSIDLIYQNILIHLQAEGNITCELKKIAEILYKILRNNPTAEKLWKLKSRPHITGFTCPKQSIKLGESVPLYLEVKNPGDRKLHYSWKMCGGGIERDCSGNFIYYGGDVGKQTITVTVMNDLGLYDSRSLKIDVIRPGCHFP